MKLFHNQQRQSNPFNEEENPRYWIMFLVGVITLVIYGFYVSMPPAKTLVNNEMQRAESACNSGKDPKACKYLRDVERQ